MTGEPTPDGAAPQRAGRTHAGLPIPRRRLPRRWRGLLLGGVWLRFRAWTHASALDRLLASGIDPIQSDELSLRAGQLSSARNRERLACALQGVVEVAGRETYPLALPRLSIRRTEVRASRELLLELAENIRTSGPLGVEGLARTSLLIGDRRGPLYRADASRPLKLSAFEALVVLQRGNETPRSTDT
jgi:hypothetical protein